jgi:hypothetical protein
MIKRLFYITLLTGFAQLFVLGVLQYSSYKLDITAIAAIGRIDSYVQLMFAIIGFGLSSMAIRRIAVSNNWKKEYYQVQSARVVVGLILCMAGFWMFRDKAFAIFFIAPLIALSGEYALYAVGKPITASFVASLRSVLPYAFLLAALFLNKKSSPDFFMTATLMAFILTDIYIARALKVNLFVVPVLNNLSYYVQSLHLGVQSFSFYFIGLGMLAVFSLLYEDLDLNIAVAFIVLKFYAIYKSIVRLIHQSFIKEMFQLPACLVIDKLSLLLSMIMASSFIIFPQTTITFIFGAQYVAHSPVFMLIALTAVIFSFAQSLGSHLVLTHNDKRIFVISVSAMTISVLTAIVLRLYSTDTWPVSISILAGETVMAVGLVSAISKPGSFFYQRLLFLLRNLSFLIIPVLLRLYIAEDTVTGMIVCISLFVLPLVLFNLKEFRSLTLSQEKIV